MTHQPDLQPAEELEQRSSSPYLRAGHELLRQIGHQTFRSNESLIDITAAETEAALYSDPLDKVPDGGITADANKITLGALETARFFVREKAEQMQQSWNALRNNPKKILQLGSVAGITAIAQPVVSAIAEKSPIIRKLDKTPKASALVPGEKGTGDYPYANAPEGSLDPHELIVGECESFAVSRVERDGVHPVRATAIIGASAQGAQEQYEVVDKIPAPGAIAIYPGHKLYVKAVDEQARTVTFEDSNGFGGPLKYGERTFSLDDPTFATGDLETGWAFIHVEKPAVADGAFYGAFHDSRNTITANGPFQSKGYIKSKNGQYDLVFSWDGNIGVYDTQNGFVKKSQSGTAGKGGKELTIVKKTGKKKTNEYELVLWGYGSADDTPEEQEESTRKRKVKTWDIGKADKLILEDDGTLSGYKGKKKIWNAPSLPSAPRAAKAAARKEAVAAKKRAIAARKARSAKQNRTATRSKAANKKATANKPAKRTARR